MVNINYKQLKTVLTLDVRSLDLASLVANLDKFSLFDYFLDLNDFSLFDFSNLDNFKSFDNFLFFNNFSNFSINLSPLLMPSFSPTASNSLATSIYDEIVIFNIDVSGAAILLKP